MNTARLEVLAGAALTAGGIALVVASLIAAGSARSWSVADAFAADSLLTSRRLGMLLGVVGLAVVVAATPSLVVRAVGTDAFEWMAVGWAGIAVGTTLFAMALGLAAILMPALGELAATGAVSPQQIADRLIRQTPIVAAFLGGNLMYLSWLVLGVGLARVPAFPQWLGWAMAVGALAGWLSFLHVPVLERVGGALWSMAITLVGAHALRLGISAAG